ncbi:hypothetical protein LCGC14_3065300 [marine sediment metagenome]|uniref:Uncharacterized protein n=1 Tax=marine sediment metagenome TaxID=412755 RepID=A0A0F8X625_9ZZZZ
MFVVITVEDGILDRTFLFESEDRALKCGRDIWIDSGRELDDMDDDPDFDPKYCANDPCESEATRLTEKGTPLCRTCAEAHSWDTASPNGSVVLIED